ncbi:MAG: PLP-dependent cysteine synthase family protein [Bdellovibrionota bacterium]
MYTSWIQDSIAVIEQDFNRSADTHLIKLPLEFPGDITLYLKDESIHPTGSLKHRLARSLFLYGICNGWIKQGTPIVEASSGSTAISEAYFAGLLNLPFHTVIPASTSQEKIKKIEFLGGKCHLVTNGDIYSAAEKLAADLGGHYMDQFTFAERATDWRANNNIAESMFLQMEYEPFPIPEWVVVSAGTGGTSATIGRYIRYKQLSTKLCVCDPENSVFYDYYKTGDASLKLNKSSRIEGIGRPRVEPSFLPSLVDRMLQVPDAASIASLEFLEKLLDRKCGGSTGTNFWASLQIISEMVQNNQTGSIVSLICDAGERYLDTYYNPDWIEKQGLDLEPSRIWLKQFEKK